MVPAFFVDKVVPNPFGQNKAPKARPIIAWGFNPRSDKEKEERAEGPIHALKLEKDFGEQL